MPDVKWIKLTTDMFNNRKVKYLRKLPDGNNIVLIWVMLLTIAGRCNAGGIIFLTENVPYTTKMLADELDFEENTVILAIKALENLNMIVTRNGYFTVAGWEEYQNIEGMDKIRAQNRLRKQRQREKQKLLEGQSNDSHVTVTHRHAIEEEREEEIEEEKDIHSIIQADTSEAQRRYLGGIGKDVVFLSNDQISDLLDKLSIEEFDRYVGIVADCELNGKTYKKKTHYQAILDMARKDRKSV